MYVMKSPDAGSMDIFFSSAKSGISHRPKIWCNFRNFSCHTTDPLELNPTAINMNSTQNLKQSHIRGLLPLYILKQERERFLYISI